ncbi:MAG TPA: NERD domain-containing protein, partial [Thermomicrobiaceae bacterium]|nr:NERD domain-containing protein [Thermomicrobiaceae bacterium]
MSRLMIVAGLLLFVASFPLLTVPSLIIFSYVTLIAGFLVFNSGMQGTAKWSHRPRPDEILDNSLRRLNDRYTLIHYPEMRGIRPEHVLVYPGGLVVITSRETYGTIQVNGNKWKKAGKLLSFLSFGGPQLGNPTSDNQRQQAALENFLESNELRGEDLIDGIIAFTHPKAEVEVIQSDYTIVKADELLDAVRDLGSEAPLPTGDREAIISALSRGENVSGPTPIPSRNPKEATAGRSRR